MYTYKAIDLNITKDDISIITSQVKSVSSDKWFFDKYRNCEILTLLDKDFNWSEAGETCSHFKKVYNEKIIKVDNNPSGTLGEVNNQNPQNEQNNGADSENKFCKTLGIKYKKSMLEPTFHGKKWWGDKFSGNKLTGIDKNFK